MYSRNPMDGRDDAISIASVWGLAKSVVDGTIPSDLFVVRRGPPMAVARREIKDKDAKYVCDAGEGVCREESTQAERSEPSLTDDQILALASMAVRLEEHYGSPQDIEWAVGRRGNLYLLQCRPLQQLEPARGEMAPAPETGTVAGTDEGLLARGGVTASPGAASGPVFVARKELDALRFPDGAVLVTAQALPRWASLPWSRSRAASPATWPTWPGSSGFRPCSTSGPRPRPWPRARS
jgi:pyruvate,water dikinase